tara:strand:+ start:507 stop:1406 length:900 start_codon:yes stop_codon:yes gene_type:complete
MSLALTGSSWVLQDNQGASEVVLDVDFTQMSNTTLNNGTTTLTLPNGETLDCHAFTPGSNTVQQLAVVNGQGLSFRAKHDGTVRYARVYFNITGSINEGKSATDPGRYNARDRIRVIAQISGTTITDHGSISFGVSNGILDAADSVGGSFAGTPYSVDYIISAIGSVAANANKLTPVALSLIGGTFTNVNYTTDTRAVTAGQTEMTLEADVRQGEGWYRFKTGSAPLGDYATSLPVPGDLTTFGHARLKPSAAVVITSDNSPFTGSVMGVFTVSSGGTTNGEFSGSISRLAILRYGAVK